MKKYKSTMSQEALDNFKTLPVHAQINYDDGFCLLNTCWQGDIELMRIMAKKVDN